MYANMSTRIRTRGERTSLCCTIRLMRGSLKLRRRKINWMPESTGTGRFGNWLENLVDWNLSRSRFWGTPLPIWRAKDGKEEICIGSMEELKAEMAKSIKAGIQKPDSKLAGHDFDLHKP